MKRLVLALMATACTANTFRNPQFTGARAPSPTVSTQVVKCLATSHASSDVIADALTADLESRTKLVTLPPEERVQLCGELGTDSAVSTWSSDWNLGATIATPLARAIAKSSSAGSLLVPLLRTVDACDKNTCTEQGVDIGLFLFSADGALLWKGTAKRATTLQVFLKPDAAALAKDVLAELPADLKRP